MKIVAYFIFAFLGIIEARADDTVAFGHVVSHKYLDVPIDCPADSICMNGWFRWIVSIDRSVAGPSLGGRIAAAHMQHGEFTQKFLKTFRFFVLRPITDSQERAKLQADYYLLEASFATEMFCMRRDPSVYGFEPERVYKLVQGDSWKYCIASADFDEP